MKLAVIGDSLTEGFPFGKKASWLNTISENLLIDVLNFGVCGETSADMNERIDRILNDDKLSHIIIFAGANDILLEDRPQNYICADIVAMQKKALVAKKEVATILPIIPNIKSYEERFINLKKNITDSSCEKIAIFDFQIVFLNNKNMFLSDNVHLSIEGNKILGDYALKIIQSWLLYKVL